VAAQSSRARHYKPLADDAGRHGLPVDDDGWDDFR
jgi:hypothetical protein